MLLKQDDRRGAAFEDGFIKNVCGMPLKGSSGLWFRIVMQVKKKQAQKKQEQRERMNNQFKNGKFTF